MPSITDNKNNAIHWFQPFGSTSFENLCSLPALDLADTRYIFYDQEPLHRDRLGNFLDNYCKTFDEPSVLITSEYNSEDALWASNTYHLDVLYYFFHGWAALDWYRGYNRTFLHQPKDIQHTFLCPNNVVGGRRRHRLDLFQELCKRNLVDTNLISMPAVCPYEGLVVKDHVASDVSLPLSIDQFDNYANNSHKITMWEQSAKCLLQVVTETSYTGNKQHLTEKSFKPIVLKQPFVLVGNQGGLKYLKKYGFETFSSVWDESYDGLPDDQRISAIGNLLEELEHSNCREWLSEQCAPIVEHNYNWFYSGKFEQVLWDELLELLNQC